LIFALRREGSKGEVYTVCTGKPTSINQLAATLKAITRKNPNVKLGPTRLGYIRNNYGDPLKLQKLRLAKGITDFG
jgi:UDP-glucose 4-epimerase